MACLTCVENKLRKAVALLDRIVKETDDHGGVSRQMIEGSREFGRIYHRDQKRKRDKEKRDAEAKA